jgi:hypothetical protein
MCIVSLLQGDRLVAASRRDALNRRRNGFGGNSGAVAGHGQPEGAMLRMNIA